MTWENLAAVDAPEDLNYATLPALVAASGDPWADIDAAAAEHIAAVLARHSDHPVSRAIAAGLRANSVEATDFKVIAGRGIQADIGGTIYVLVVAMALVGLGIVVAGAWRTGLVWMGVGMLLGALTRAVLSERAAGMLRVRRRWSDVLMLTIAGIGLIVLAVIVPDQPL